MFHCLLFRLRDPLILCYHLVWLQRPPLVRCICCSFLPYLSIDPASVSDMTQATLTEGPPPATPQSGPSCVDNLPSAYPYSLACVSTPSCSTVTQINTTSLSSLPPKTNNVPSKVWSMTVEPSDDSVKRT
ncbi:hypothetical protein HHX47_DHR9000576 [Lentinula edodes]|nr:hypothetical protein HHX47_DHR9000576 [Lentinula edodes]